MVDKQAAVIRAMFAEVAPRYDFLNRLLSVRLDVRWRRRAARALAGAPEGPLLDLCSGTGDQALAVQRTLHRPVVAADFCLPMLALAARKGVDGLAADALALPFPTDRFAGATVAFGLRNVADLEAALGEIHRVLLPGGRLAALEFALPRGWVRPLYLFYFRHVLPRIGAWLSPRGSAYTYLPDSVSDFPQRGALTALLAREGFAEANWTDLSGGTVCLYSARKAA